jgi:anaerobic ribonucleoside-triphosphate reductase
MNHPDSFSSRTENQKWLLDVPRALPACVRKRDGRLQKFELRKLASALAACGRASGEFGDRNAEAMADTVAARLAADDRPRMVTADRLQKLLEEELAARGCYDSVRVAIAFGERKRARRERRRVMVDAVASVQEYVTRADWRVQANANQGYSLGGMILSVAGKVTANYWLSEVYPEVIGQAHREGDFHIHDLDMLSGYCAGWSLRMLLTEGFNGVPNKVESKPPRHLRTALGQMVNFLGTLQNEWAGAQAFSSFDTYLAPFVRADRMRYADVRQCMQEFIFNLNVPSRWGTQTPFTNLTFDLTCPADLRSQQPLIGGRPMPFCYGDLQEEMDMINRAFLEVMMEGDARERVFTFPIPTYNVTADFPWEGPNSERLFEMTAKYGLPYFQNFLNSDLEPGMVRSMCCRLQLDLRELLKRGNGLFGSAEQTGSVGVVTINAARLGYLCAGSRNAFFADLDRLLGLARDSLEIKRRVIQEQMDNGLFPFTRRYLGTLRNHFSTIGINGVNECIRNFTGDRENIATPWGYEFALEILGHMRERMVKFQEETGHLYNLEASPAEGATHRFARIDRQKFPDILHAGTPEAPYYTNSTQLPVNWTDDPFAALDHQEALQRQYTGGTVFHIYLNERVSSSRACRELVRRVLQRFRVPYITVTPTFSICPVHGYLAGEHPYCPRCDAERLAAKQRAVAA